MRNPNITKHGERRLEVWEIYDRSIDPLLHHYSQYSPDKCRMYVIESGSNTVFAGSVWRAERLAKFANREVHPMQCLFSHILLKNISTLLTKLFLNSVKLVNKKCFKNTWYLLKLINKVILNFVRVKNQNKNLVKFYLQVNFGFLIEIKIFLNIRNYIV